ncbi:F0F1 ATP synthase subunit B [Sedimentisphaera salicampi]|uniref:ATP synthase subunit b n=1 Tax=Sedimentisphaera salicampi TaxID=1941349 RepID=A0A1W6LK75_9BACT|nr:F0F1 ATP synthase subunit B [Sedimentisphaera salicampi]ARN56134.1 F-type ATPase subunit b [Sedimentisphaera salicampi]OXU15703.1 F-type ATPase subunit b [Sedimentisphaera salicampi]
MALFEKIRYLLLCFSVNAVLLASETAAGGAEGESEKVNIFSGYLSESIWTLVWFAVLVFMLGKFVWKPMLAGLKAREDHISGEINSAEEMKKEAGQKLEQYQSKLENAEKDGKKAAQKHISEAEKKSQEILSKAMSEADEIKARAREDAKKAAESAKGSFVDEAGTIVCSLGSRIIGRVITPEDNKQLIDQAVDEFKKSYISGNS